MAWYHQKTKLTKDFEELTKTYNEKYGHYDYGKDSRSIDATFRETLLKAVDNLANLNVLVCGSNAGYEIEILSEVFPQTKFTAVDISTDALNELSLKKLNTASLHANMESLPFKEKEFDVYVNCRAIHSTNVDMNIAVTEAIRVTKDKIILSVSNGYNIEGVLVNGMYDYDSAKFDTDKPMRISEQLGKYLEQKSYTVEQFSSDAELFIVATIKNQK